MTRFSNTSMTKAEKFRRAATICWWIGTLLTWNFLRTLLPETMDPIISSVIAAAAALGLQYVLTLVEGTIISGLLPLPWHISFERNSTEAILSIAAFGCFFFDLLLNLGGTYTITQHLGKAMGDTTKLGISSSIIDGIIAIATLFFAALFALGSELLDGLANLYEGKHQAVTWTAHDMRDIPRVSGPRSTRLPTEVQPETHINGNRNPIDTMAQNIEERQRNQKGRGL